MKKLLWLVCAGSCAAGEFVNLTFDEPDVTGPLTPVFPGGPTTGDGSALLRGWTVTVGGVPLPRVTYSPPLTTSVGPITLRGNDPANTVLGPYSLQLESSPPSVPEIRISQRGTIPADAAGLRFFGGGYVQMFVNGERAGDSLGIEPIDVSRWSGQEVNLEFLVRRGESARFDIFGFTPIPEPSTWALFGVGAAGVCWFGRWKR